MPNLHERRRRRHRKDIAPVKPIGSRTRSSLAGSPTWCSRHNKRKYTSRKQALKASEQKYGAESNAYLCNECGSWHITRRDTRLDPTRQAEATANEVADRLVAALGIDDSDEPT